MLLRSCDDRLALEALLESTGCEGCKRKENWITDAESSKTAKA